ncbi:MAG: mechanosensitive ion channel [Alphaproteobacteria bacterium]|jgi:small conductance mechanosensitive channel|nr:mechanosensitive ion channel [Alphaproteobacteria bacterium]
MRPTPLKSIVLALSLLIAVPAVAPPAAAEDKTPAAGPVSTADLDALVQTIENEKDRKAFLANLKALIAARQATETEKPADSGFGARLLEEVSAKIDAVSRGLVATASAVLDLPQAFAWLRDGFSDPATRSAWLLLLVKLVVILLAGFVLEGLAKLVLRRPRGAIEEQHADGFLPRALLLVARTLLDVAPIVAFAAAAYGVMTLVAPSHTGRLVAIALVNASVLARAILAIARLVLVPKISEMRLLPIGDETANYCFIWLRRLTNLTVYGYFVAQAALLLGLPFAAHAVLVKLIGLVVGLLLVMLAMQNRGPIADRIAGDGEAAFGALRRRLAEVWHILVVLYVVAIFGIWLLEVPGGFEFVSRATALTIVILIVAGLAAGGTMRAIRRLFALSDEVKARLPGLEERANLYLPALRTTVRGLVYAVALLAVLEAWGLGVFGWLVGPTGREILARVVTIALIVVGALIVWEMVSALIQRYLSAADEDGETIERSQRARTLLPLLRNLTMIVLAVLVALTVLSEIGINIGPLLAGAGIFGLAVGFGAQTLVKDVIRGLFILLENSISVGDVISVGGHSGVVEAMSIRSVRLRDVGGVVHLLPFSEVTTVVNMTRDYAYALFDIGVGYREDVDEVMAAIRATGEEIQADPKFAADIIDEIEIMGVQSFDDSAVVIRARLRTKPRKQFAVRRAFNRLLKIRFDALGIEIPYPHQTIYFGEDKHGNAPPLHIQNDDPEAG